MFYSGNDNYMQDLYFNNPMPNTYNNMCMSNFDNGMQNPMYMNNGMQNPNMFMRQNQQPNINTLYPSTYRILMPVVSRVVSNSNYQFLNEDVLNNMVDTVYNITEGQIDYETEQDSVQERTNSTQANSTSVSQTNQNNSTTTNVTNTRINSDTQTTRNNSSTNTRNDDLLRDLIKILIIREIISRRQFQSNNMNMYNMNQAPGNMGQYCNL